MRVTVLQEHDVIKVLSPLMRKFLLRGGPENKGRIQATEREEYAIYTSENISKITDCIDQLYFCLTMLSGYRSHLQHPKMNRYDYLMYQMENFYFRITSVHDRSLLLTNYLYDFGLPDKEVKYNTIIKNKHIHGTPVAQALKLLDKFTQNYRPQRNQVAHKEPWAEHKLTVANGFFMVNTPEYPELNQYAHLYNKITNNWVTEKRAELNPVISELENHVSQFFDAILPQLQSEIEKRAD